MKHHSKLTQNAGRRLTISLALLLALSAPAVRAQTQTQFSGWLATFQTYKLSDKTGIYFDGQYRTTNHMQQMHSLLLRPGFNYFINPNFVATVGYAFIPQQRSSGGVTGYIPEHRTWEQLMVTHKVKFHHAARNTTLAHRFRLEQRYLPKFHAEGDHLVHDNRVYAGRFRYFTRGIIPLTGAHKDHPPVTSAVDAPLAKTGTGPRAFTKGFFASLQNEIFFNIGDNSPVNGKLFDQNRAYVSFGYRYSKQFDVELGYMNQYINGAGSTATSNHILQVATYVRL